MKRFACLITLLVLLAMRLASLAGSGTEQAGAGPSFPCEKAATSTEKLICSDRNLSALDLEYSRLYNRRLRESGSAEAARIKSEAQSFLEQREHCYGHNPDETLKPYRLDCIESSYYSRIAQWSQMPATAPAEWSPRLVAGVHVYDQKRVPDSYFKVPDKDRLFRLKQQEGMLQPAAIDRSVSYRVYRDVLGSLTSVVEYRDNGHLDLEYFFNKNGRLAAIQRRFDAHSGSGVYVEYETVFYNAAVQETRRSLHPF